MQDDAGNTDERPSVKKRSCWDRLRYWVFKDSQIIDEQTAQITKRVDALRKAAREFDAEFAKVSQEDALRSLVISMNKPRGGGANAK